MINRKSASSQFHGSTAIIKEFSKNFPILNCIKYSSTQLYSQGIDLIRGVQSGEEPIELILISFYDYKTHTAPISRIKMMGEEVVVELPPDDLPEEEIEALDTFEASEQVLEPFAGCLFSGTAYFEINYFWLEKNSNT